MSQHDMVVSNGPGEPVRLDINAALQALATCSSGAVEPVTKYAGMLWLDTSVVPNGLLRQRNQSNTGWVTSATSAALPIISGTDTLTDWNDLTAAGFHGTLLGTTNPHHPFAGQYFFCFNIVFSATNVTQIAYPYALGASIDSGIWFRGRFSGAWSLWQNLAQIVGGNLTVPGAIQSTIGPIAAGVFSATGATSGQQSYNTGATYRSTNSSATFSHERFYSPTAPNLNGQITTNGTVTAYVTSSDENFKEFNAEMDPAEAIAVIRADPVLSFTWKESGEQAIGWFAQKSYAVDPNLAVPPGDPTEEDIAMREDPSVEPKPGEEGYVPWGIDYGRRTPYLWAALTAALDQIDQLTARIAALEAAAAGP